MIDYSRLLAPIKNSIRNLVVRGILEAVDDSDGIQVVKATLLKGEPREGYERAQQFGFTSNPPKGSELLFLCIGGKRDNVICIAANDQASRMTGIESGESSQYTSDGSYLILRLGGNGVLNVENELKLGSESAADPLVRKSDLDAVVSSVNTELGKLATHAHTGVTTGGGTSGPAAVPNSPTIAPATGSDKLKAD